MKLDDKIVKQINDDIYRIAGMSYEEFMMLDFDVQQEIIKEYHKKNNKKCLFKKKENPTVMIGSGEDAIFMDVKKGSKVMLFDGTIVEAGRTIDEYRNRQEKRLNEITKVSVKERVKSLFRRK